MTQTVLSDTKDALSDTNDALGDTDTHRPAAVVSRMGLSFLACLNTDTATGPDREGVLTLTAQTSPDDNSSHGAWYSSLVYSQIARMVTST